MNASRPPRILSTPIPGFPGDSNVFIFFGRVIYQLDTRLFRQAACGPLAWSVLPTYLQQLVILSGLAVRSFSTEVYTSALGCCSGQNWSVLGKHKMRQKKATPTENFELLHADSYIKLSRKQPQPTKSSHVPCMGCVRASDAPNSSRRQPENNDCNGTRLFAAVRSICSCF